ncbi:uncharacterized protein LOC134817155 [Bolinopsis microptera]|uniref:uncharacterized protein LOC134817155 n=1 Tax=Bolinopsis microptera TaxID=2820187 RepID=UPI00307A356B
MNETTGYSKEVDCVWGSVGIVFCCFSVIANGLLVYVFVALRRKESVTDIIFLQLATLDCLSGIAGLFGSIFLVNERKWFEDDKSVLGDVICYPTGMLWNMASLTTPLLLGSASIGRFLAVYCPFTYEKYFKSNVVKGMIIYCWSHGFIGAAISFAGPNRDVKAYQMFVDWGYCDQTIFDSFNSDAVRKVIYIALFTVPVIVSCFLIITCNILVAVKILVMKNQSRKQKKKKKKQTSSCHQPSILMRNALSRIRSIKCGETIKLSKNCNQVAINPIISGSPAEDSPKPPPRDKKVLRQRRKENQAILMTILLSCNYFICYIEIIHYYVTVSIGMDWEQSYVVIFKNVTYVYLWYYFSLFFASGNNAILHLCFNPNVKRFVKRLFFGSDRVPVTLNSSI